MQYVSLAYRGMGVPTGYKRLAPLRRMQRLS